MSAHFRLLWYKPWHVGKLWHIIENVPLWRENPEFYMIKQFDILIYNPKIIIFQNKRLKFSRHENDCSRVNSI